MAPLKQARIAHVEGEIVIGRPVEEVFDYVADERNEPTFNARMSRVELLTPEPIGVGSRFSVEMMMMMGRVFDLTVEFTAFERPRLLGSTSRSLPRGGKGRPLLTAGSLTFDPVPEGTRMRCQRPHRALALRPPNGRAETWLPGWGEIQRHDRLGGLIHEYYRAAA